MNEKQTTVEAPPAPARVAMTVDRMVEKFIALRDKADELKKRQQAELAPYTQAMGQLEALLLQALLDNRVDSMKAPAGLFYKHTRTSVSVRDWGLALSHIRDNELWELLDPRVSKTAAQAILDETGQPIPGVAITREIVVQVRRA